MKEGRFPSLCFLVRFVGSVLGFFAAGLELFLLFRIERKSGLLGLLNDFIHEVLKNLGIELRCIYRTVPFHIAFLELEAVRFVAVFDPDRAGYFVGLDRRD